MDTKGPPETVTRQFLLRPSVPLHRAGDAATIRIPASCPSYIVSVKVNAVEITSRRYELRILDAGSRELWRDEDAPVDPAGRLLVHLRKGFLPHGEYHLDVRVLIRSDGEDKARGAYPFLIE